MELQIFQTLPFYFGGMATFLKILHIILIVIKQMSWLLALPQVICTVRSAFSFYIFFFFTCNHCSTYGLITHVQSIIAIHITMEMHSCYGCTILKNIFYFTDHLLLTILKHLAFFKFLEYKRGTFHTNKCNQNIFPVIPRLQPNFPCFPCLRKK